MSLRIDRARLVRDGRADSTLSCVFIEGDAIRAIWPGSGEMPECARAADAVLDARGRAVLPGFVDAHTHAAWAGDRLDEWEAKLAGASYLDLLEAGGGIMATVRAVRAASCEVLAAALRARLDRMLREGTTTIEVKSGYGLTTRDELRMLEAIREAARGFPGTVVPTALLGHAIDPEQPDGIDCTIAETLPAVHESFPGVAIDAFCEKGAWPLDACERLFRAAIALGHPVRVHADQFNAQGMTALAIDLRARSVDHLEATDPADLRRLARSDCHGVMLPVASFHLDAPYALGRDFLDAGGKLVLATNLNPGSAPSASMPFVIALACRKLGLTPAEAIVACTKTAAELLDLPDRGAIAPGLRADLVVLAHEDPRMLAFELGGNPVDHVVCAGVQIT